MVEPLSVDHLLYSTVAELSAASVQSGAQAWATDGRKVGEGAGLGTGCLVYADNQSGTVAWRRLSDDSVVAA